MPSTEPLEIFVPTLERLAARWSSAGPLLPGFPLLARGRPVSLEEIAAAVGTKPDQVRRSVDAARCERDERGRLIDLFGLTLTPTIHRLSIDGKILFGCCALWTHVVPILVNRTVQVESVDPVRRELVRLELSPEAIESVTPSGSVATLAVASQDAIERDVGEAWCSRVSHFVSRESAQEFAAGRPTCHVVELREFHQVTELFYQAIWSAIES